MRSYQDIVTHVEGLFADAQARSLSRRGMMTTAAKVAGGGAIALAIAGTPMVGRLRHVSAQDFSGDQDIIDYALTLEHLEYAFYRDGLNNFSTRQFRRLGRTDIRGRFLAIRDHEAVHVDTLQGFSDVQECTYDFGYSDIKEFAAIAQVLENTGVKAYLGAAPFIQSADVLALAGSIVTVEARHAAYLNQINGDSPFPSAFDDSASRDEVLGAAGGFIVSCP